MAGKAKTVPSRKSVATFLGTVGDAQRRRDCEVLVELMSGVTGEKPVMWGDAIVGFGKYRYANASGREGDSPLASFSPRKGDISIYVMPDLGGFDKLLAQLGPHKAGRSCLQVKRLEDVDLKVLRQIVAQSVKALGPRRSEA